MGDKDEAIVGLFHKKLSLKMAETRTQYLIIGFQYYYYFFLDSLSSICNMASNVSITLNVIKHSKNMYDNDPMSFLPYLTLLFISYREKNKWSDKLVIYSRLLQISILIPSNSQAFIAVMFINNFDFLSLSPLLTNLHSHAIIRI